MVGKTKANRRNRNDTKRPAKDGAKKRPSTQSKSVESPNSSTTSALNSTEENALDGREGAEFVVVGIGASAGGLEAFKTFLKNMPADTGMAFVLIQHLSPDHESLMAELLSKCTAMPVIQVNDTIAIQPNHVYMIPPKKFIQQQADRLLLVEPVKQGGMRMPIDYFFRSLADQKQERAVGIILSGTGSDGTLGLKEIKAAGGMVMVQRPQSAQYEGMPNSALATGMVDFVCEVEEMAGVLSRYIQHSYVVETCSGEPTLLETAPDDYESIIELLRAHTEFDFRGYKKGTLSRRIQRRMGLRHVERIADYLGVLREDRDEINLLFKDLLISVTAFFREMPAWGALREYLAKLVADKRFDHPARIWVPGCSTGEEAYSIAMLLYEEFELQNKNLDIQIFATDLDADAIETARQGIYPSSIAADISPTRLKKFFHEERDHYRVNKRLRESAVFAVQNLIGDPPFSNLDLISCRNVLIYLEQEIQQKLLQMFHFALRPDGYLFLGTSESAGKQSRLFKPLSTKWRIYQKQGRTQRKKANFPIIPATQRVEGAAVVEDHDYGQPFGAIEFARKVLLERFAPASVLINAQCEVQYFHGPVRQYLDIPSGEPTTDLTAMCLEGLRSKLRGIISRCLKDATSGSVVAQRVRRDGHTVSVRIDVELLPKRKVSETLLLVSFTDQDTSNLKHRRPYQSEAGRLGAPDHATGDHHEESDEDPAARQRVTTNQLVEQLEIELQATREDLQSTIEELETSNEELKASNEEIMSMNEELQSTNEELETSREELQSLNEELSTVNNQLEEKVEELEHTNNDLRNLLSSTEIATIFLDTDFRIRRFTPATSEFFHVIESDIGRPVSDLSPQFNDSDLYHDAHLVLEKLTPIEREVCLGEQHAQAGGAPKWFMRRILPYRTSDNKIDGVVLTFTDVTILKESARRLEERERQAAVVASLGAAALAAQPFATLLEDAVKKVADTLHVPLCKVLQLSNDRKHFRLVAGVGWKDGLVNQATVEAGIHSQAGFTLHVSAPVIVENLENERRFRGPSLLIEHGVVSGLSVVIGPIENPWGVLGAHCKRPRQFTVDDANFIQAVANVLWDAIERVEVEAELLESHELIRTIAENSTQALIMMDEHGYLTYCNAAWLEMTGYDAVEIRSKPLHDLVHHHYPDGREYPISECPIDSALPQNFDLRYHADIFFRRDGSTFPVLCAASPIFKDGRPVSTVIEVRDMTAVRQAEMSVSESEERLRLAAEAANFGTYDLDFTSGQVYWSPQMRQILGVNDHDIAEIRPGEVSRNVHADDRQRVAEKIEAAIDPAGPGIFDDEHQIVWPDGQIRWVHLRGRTQFEGSGNCRRPVRSIGIGLDITARKTAELTLKKLNETLEQKIEERTGLVKLLHDVTVACHHADSLNEAIAYVLREFSRFDGWCFGHAYHPAEGKPDELVPFLDCYEQVPGKFRQFRQATQRLRLPCGEGLPGRVFATGKAEYIVADVAQHVVKRHDEVLAAEIKTAAAFPVKVGEEVVAVLEFFSDKKHQPDARIMESMENIGSQLGRVVERQRLHREIAELASSEQQRIGSELHDTLLQQLTGGQMVTESVRQQVANGKLPEESQIANVVKILKDAQKEVRRLHRGLMPVEVDSAGLMNALENLAGQTVEMHNVECRFQCDREVLIRDRTRAAYLYRIAQEAVHNAVKHGHPKHITIGLEAGKQIRLTIQDDGRGFSKDPRKISGSGIRIMRYRAEVIGGHLTIESKAGKGTTVECSVRLGT